MSHVVIPTSTYARTFRALIAFTGLTILVAFIDLGAWNPVVALAIAATKASLVGLYFMGLRWADRLTRVGLVVSLAAVVVLFAGVLNDDLTRTTRTYLPAEEIRPQERLFRVRGLDGLAPGTDRRAVDRERGASGGPDASEKSP